LGWFCFFVGITVIPITLQAFGGAQSGWDVWFAVCWASWAVLWLLFWALLALKKPIAKMTGAICATQGVYTGWIPGYLLLTGAISLQDRDPEARASRIAMESLKGGRSDADL
jgi:hypothetical protein